MKISTQFIATVEVVWRILHVKELEIENLRVPNGHYAQHITHQMLCSQYDEMCRVLDGAGFPGVKVAESASETYYKFSKERALAGLNSEGRRSRLFTLEVAADRIVHADSEGYLMDGCGECHRMPDCACDMLRAVQEAKSVLQGVKA